MNFEAVISIMLFCIFVAILSITILTPIGVSSAQAHVKVEDYVGINLDTDKLYFGTVAPGGSAQRVMISSSGKNAFVLTSISGEASEWISAGENNFFIKANKNHNIQFTVEVPKQAAKKNYTADVTLIFYRPVMGLFFAQ